MWAEVRLQPAGAVISMDGHILKTALRIFCEKSKSCRHCRRLLPDRRSWLRPEHRDQQLPGPVKWPGETRVQHVFDDILLFGRPYALGRPAFPGGIRTQRNLDCRANQPCVRGGGVWGGVCASNEEIVKLIGNQCATAADSLFVIFIKPLNKKKQNSVTMELGKQAAPAA